MAEGKKERKTGKAQSGKEQKIVVSCPLNDLDLPPVSDTEHLTNNCFCRYCVCGNHICPKRPIFPSNAGLSSRSKYTTDFRKHKNKRRNRNKMHGYHRASVDHSGKKSHIFQDLPEISDKIRNQSHRRSNTMTSDITNDYKTTYQEQFNTHNDQKYDPNVKYGKDLKSSIQSFYAQDFWNKQNSSGNYKFDKKNNSNRNSSQIISPSHQWHGRSNSCASISLLSQHKLSIPKKPSQRDFLVSPPNHFSSTYKSDFPAKSTRRRLVKRRSIF